MNLIDDDIPQISNIILTDIRFTDEKTSFVNAIIKSIELNIKKWYYSNKLEL